MEDNSNKISRRALLLSLVGLGVSSVGIGSGIAWGRKDDLRKPEEIPPVEKDLYEVLQFLGESELSKDINHLVLNANDGQTIIIKKNEDSYTLTLPHLIPGASRDALTHMSSRGTNTVDKNYKTLKEALNMAPHAVLTPEFSSFNLQISTSHVVNEAEMPSIEDYKNSALDTAQNMHDLNNLIPVDAPVHHSNGVEVIINGSVNYDSATQKLQFHDPTIESNFEMNLFKNKDLVGRINIDNNPQISYTLDYKPTSDHVFLDGETDLLPPIDWLDSFTSEAHLVQMGIDSRISNAFNTFKE